ncbi:MAG: hypothetical protein SLAVMIC_00060 [uncultured marine phage]|uniref:Uncharacterized protein n=1 Tax=uncultured marine phage TaxID=707152 RepID=A0A8D9FRT8_9VIRU|nr:MAG: hypothetical protein SLAVMIC_00060 [uncultured marine phage]
MSIHNIQIKISPKNKWGLIVSDGKRDYHIAIPPRKEGYDFIDRNLKYHYDYKGCVGMGILVKIENSVPRAILIKDKFTRIWRLDERFEEHSRYFKPKRNTDR